MLINYQKGGTQKNIYLAEDVEDIDCLQCGSNKNIKIHSEFGSIGIVRCNECNLVFTSPRPKNSEKNYDGNIKDFEKEYNYFFEDLLEHHRDKNYRQEIFIIKKHIPTGKLLDVGCNAGRFLSLAIHSGYEGFGIEPSESLAKLGKDKLALNIENCTLNRTKHKNKSFDVITAIDVFEHITNPLNFLRDCRNLLKDNGKLIIKIPNGNYSLFKLKLAKLLNKNIENLDIFDSYEHAVHHNKKSFKKMIEKENFIIEKIYAPYPINPPVWANYVGQYYQYPSPWFLDWKKIFLRKIFNFIGSLEVILGLEIHFQPDLMFILKKN